VYSCAEKETKMRAWFTLACYSVAVIWAALAWQDLVRHGFSGTTTIGICGVAIMLLLPHLYRFPE
jgi:hypothetical protein